MFMLQTTEHPDHMPLNIDLSAMASVLLTLICLLLLCQPSVEHIFSQSSQQGCILGLIKDPVIHTVDIDFDNLLYWDGEAISQSALEQHFAQIAKQDDQAEIHVRPNPIAQYQYVAAVFAAAQRLGVQKIGAMGNT